MKIFISWSGSRSKAVATLLRKWIPDVIQQVEPWASHIDINAGARWNNEIQECLSEVKFGVICLTGTNLNAPWILFEAGALAKTLDSKFVCPYLIDVNESTIPGGPLSQFQAKKADKEGTWDLIRAINLSIKDSGLTEETLKRSFERCWPELEGELSKLPPDDGEQFARTPEDKLDEILTIARELKRSSIRNIYITDSNVSADLSAIASYHDLGKINTLFQKYGRISRSSDDDGEPESA